MICIYFFCQLLLCRRGTLIEGRKDTVWRKIWLPECHGVSGTSNYCISPFVFCLLAGMGFDFGLTLLLCSQKLMERFLCWMELFSLPREMNVLIKKWLHISHSALFPAQRRFSYDLILTQVVVDILFSFCHHSLCFSCFMSIVAAIFNVSVPTLLDMHIYTRSQLFWGSEKHGCFSCKVGYGI